MMLKFNSKTNKVTNKTGFTLIEIMVAVSIFAMVLNSVISAVVS